MVGLNFSPNSPGLGSKRVEQFPRAKTNMQIVARGSLLVLSKGDILRDVLRELFGVGTLSGRFSIKPQWPRKGVDFGAFKRERGSMAQNVGTCVHPDQNGSSPSPKRGQKETKGFQALLRVPDPQRRHKGHVQICGGEARQSLIKGD